MTKVDKQIDEMQKSIADKLMLIVNQINRKINRIIAVYKLDKKSELIKKDLISISLYVENIKNLASDLKRDARL